MILALLFFIGDNWFQMKVTEKLNSFNLNNYIYNWLSIYHMYTDYFIGNVTLNQHLH